ncbi:hypothetical protein [Candidatus Phytoplasma solani]|uniref:hypothetical protein n=1 Tax=Candidatus Phytoplasma solani TaxID=69896 RepID=UPI00041BF09F|nr:hypothetical protein [Candidatus Phytoplasma solani]
MQFKINPPTNQTINDKTQAIINSANQNIFWQALEITVLNVIISDMLSCFALKTSSFYSSSF